ncbi:MAG TPA: acylphosphatase [Candidatus Limnocylindrales bacterium]
MDERLARVDAVVRGRVQGVGYRFYVLSEARRLRLTGWVRNEWDGSVRCVVEGAPGSLDALVRSLHDGPAGAWVDDVAVLRGPATGEFARFEIRSRGHPGD